MVTSVKGDTAQQVSHRSSAAAHNGSGIGTSLDKPNADLSLFPLRGLLLSDLHPIEALAACLVVPSGFCGVGDRGSVAFVTTLRICSAGQPACDSAFWIAGLVQPR